MERDGKGGKGGKGQEEGRERKGQRRVKERGRKREKKENPVTSWLDYNQTELWELSPSPFLPASAGKVSGELPLQVMLPASGSRPYRCPFGLGARCSFLIFLCFGSSHSTLTPLFPAYSGILPCRLQTPGMPLLPTLHAVTSEHYRAMQVSMVMFSCLTARGSWVCPEFPPSVDGKRIDKERHALCCPKVIPPLRPKPVSENHNG